MEIPQAFLETMRGLLGAEYSAFEAAFLRQPPVRGLRVNTLKLPAEEFAAIRRQVEAGTYVPKTCRKEKTP